MKFNSITSITLVLFSLLVLNISFVNAECYNCSTISQIIKITDFVPTVSEQNIVLDFNISCKVPNPWVDKNISIYSVVVKKNDSIINSNSFTPIINCVDNNYQKKIELNECSEAVYSVSFNYDINEVGCSSGKECKGLTKFVPIKSCNPNYDEKKSSIPDNNFVSIIFVFICVILFISKSQRKK